MAMNDDGLPMAAMSVRFQPVRVEWDLWSHVRE